MDKTIKSITNRFFSLRLVQIGETRYKLELERPGVNKLEYETDDLKYALARFDDIRVKAEGN